MRQLAASAGLGNEEAMTSDFAMLATSPINLRLEPKGGATAVPQEGNSNLGEPARPGLPDDWTARL